MMVAFGQLFNNGRTGSTEAGKVCSITDNGKLRLSIMVM